MRTLLRKFLDVFVLMASMFKTIEHAMHIDVIRVMHMDQLQDIHILLNFRQVLSFICSYLLLVIEEFKK